jgi:hypothetical protein
MSLLSAEQQKTFSHSAVFRDLVPATQSSADCIINMFGFDLLQAQSYLEISSLGAIWLRRPIKVFRCSFVSGANVNSFARDPFWIALAIMMLPLAVKSMTMRRRSSLSLDTEISLRAFSRLTRLGEPEHHILEEYIRVSLHGQAQPKSDLLIEVISSRKTGLLVRKFRGFGFHLCNNLSWMRRSTAQILLKHSDADRSGDTM